jgi:hypothetical protein
MHANLSISDGVYGILSDTDLQKQISSLGKKTTSGGNKEEKLKLIQQLLQEL